MFEEINANVIVVGDYKAYNKDNPSTPVYVDVLVRTPRRDGRTTGGRGAAQGGGSAATRPAAARQGRLRMCPTPHHPPPPPQVTDPGHSVLHSAKAQPKGQFAFTSKSAGEYKACFTTAGVCAG